jgi:cell wall-associated NlpC family hydrolase
MISSSSMWANTNARLVRPLLDGVDMRAIALALTSALLLVAVEACAPGSEDPSDFRGPPIADNGGEDELANSAGDVGDDTLEDTVLVAVDDGVPALPDTATIMADAREARATANVNLRKAASASASIITIVPSGAVVTLVSTTPTSSFHNIRWNGIVGWAHSSYLTPIAAEGDDDVDVNGPPSPANTIARAKSATGFSYWWGAGAWLEQGVSASTRGSCSGSCPSCSHSGRYGADCSGLVAKAWQFGAKELSVNAHPYNTTAFNTDLAGKWRTVTRSSIRAGDALVYASGGAGHIVIYEKGDAWGSPTVFECRGCSYGCVHNARSFGSTYHAIRCAGF